MNDKETDYLKIVRTQPAVEQNELVPEKQKLTFRERIEWRGIEPSTIIITGLAYLTVVTAACILLTGAIISLL
mgnify:CR=1 FL=1|jgi:hypothetical protein